MITITEQKPIEEVMQELDYKKLKDATFGDKVPLVGPMASLIFEKGIY